MALDNKIVQQIAHLAHLHIDDQQVTQYATELGNILDLVEQMNAADTTGVEPMTHPFDATLRLREDNITEHDQRTHLQKVAPAAQDGLYLVPKVLD